MSVILVLGGYGGFGSRLSRELARKGHEVIAAGRNEKKALEFAARTPGVRGEQMERSKAKEALARLRPNILVDASGPFQDADYSVARACAEAGVHYLDLADGRAFVGGIAELDSLAREKNVVVVSGASSVPGLSGAVARHLAKGMSHVELVEAQISSTSRATAGDAVVKAILSYIGRPVRIRRGGRWQTAIGWGEPRWEDFEADGRKPLRHRMTQIADVPDHDSLPESLPGCPSAVFRAGGEIALGNRALRAAGWLARLGIVKSLSPTAPFWIAAARATRG